MAKMKMIDSADIPAGTAVDAQGFPVAAPVKETLADKPVSSAEMAGGYTRLKTEDGVFFARSPKLRQQIAMMEAANSIAVIEEAPLDAMAAAAKQMAGLAGMARHLIFVPESAGGYRAATEDEVLDAFDATDLNEIMARYSDLRQNAESGN